MVSCELCAQSARGPYPLQRPSRIEAPCIAPPPSRQSASERGQEGWGSRVRRDNKWPTQWSKRSRFSNSRVQKSQRCGESLRYCACAPQQDIKMATKSAFAKSSKEPHRTA
eukprot:2401407-Pleurochrysis_carterae.AAC.2